MIKIYSTEKCKYCKEAKKYFDENHIEYIEVNVGKDKDEFKEMAELTCQVGVPVIRKGRKFMVGWDKDKFIKLNNNK